MTDIAGEWLSGPATQSIFAMLTDAGHQAYVVGGCVRNTLLGLPVVDVDFATSATPDQTEALALSSHLKSYPTGKDFGTITVVSNGQSFEVTTFREDVSTNGRRAVVAFASTISKDAERRDFTMNALYADAGGRVLDPLRGLPDLLARRVKFIGDPDARITEDYLRILRFFRFYALYSTPDIGLDAEGLAACAANTGGLDILSKERVGAEMQRLLAAPDPAPACAAMARSGVLMRILPGADTTALAVLVHHEAQAGLSPDWIRRLAAIGGQDVADHLNLSRKNAKARDLLQRSVADNSSLPDLSYRFGATVAKDAAVLRAAMLGSPLPPDFAASIGHAAGMVFPLGAADLMPALQGAALGRQLKHLEDIWIKSGFTASRSDLLGADDKG